MLSDSKGECCKRHVTIKCEKPNRAATEPPPLSAENINLSIGVTPRTEPEIKTEGSFTVGQYEGPRP